MSSFQTNFQTPTRLTAKKTIKPVNFHYLAPAAKAVALVGDFNAWNPEANPMVRSADGGWSAQIMLKEGHHRYQFIVDGVFTLDPKAQGIARNDKNERVSLIAVS